MIKPSPLPLLALILTATACSPGSTQVGSVADEATPETGAASAAAARITPDGMLARIAFLAADSLAGRDTPSPGQETAAAYLVSEHQSFGLEPGGENSTFYQRYPFVARGSAPGQEQSFPPNVVALLPGSDPELRDEYVVLSAHFDHVGVGRPVDGDSIYNGADDNGSGTAALLEVASALASLPENPARSVLFLHVSGEEHGLLGSEWFSENPTVPAEQIVANINVDMIGRNAPDSIVVIGRNYSNLGTLMDRVAAERPELGLTIVDDPWPQERFFFRSDHYNFARIGIPAVFVFAGVHEDYHQPSDEVEKIDPEKAARVARMIFHSAIEIANAPERPEWHPEGLAAVQGMTR